jgi:hypothetical protein
LYTRFKIGSGGLAGAMSSMVNTGSTKQHVQRQLRKLSERTELELLVAGTEFADLERAVFKATKNNTKSPKEKHVQFIINAIHSQRLSGASRTAPQRPVKVWPITPRSGPSPPPPSRVCRPQRKVGSRCRRDDEPPADAKYVLRSAPAVFEGVRFPTLHAARSPPLRRCSGVQSS